MYKVHISPRRKSKDLVKMIKKLIKVFELTETCPSKDKSEKKSFFSKTTDEANLQFINDHRDKAFNFVETPYLI